MEASQSIVYRPPLDRSAKKLGKQLDVGPWVRKAVLAWYVLWGGPPSHARSRDRQDELKDGTYLPKIRTNLSNKRLVVVKSATLLSIYWAYPHLMHSGQPARFGCR